MRSVLASDRSHMAVPSHRESSRTVDFGGQNRCATQPISTLQYSGLCCAQSTQEPDHNSPIGGLHSRKPHSTEYASCEDPPKAKVSCQNSFTWRDIVSVMARYRRYIFDTVPSSTLLHVLACSNYAQTAAVVVTVSLVPAFVVTWSCCGRN